MWTRVSLPLPLFPVLTKLATRAMSAGVPALHALSPSLLVTIPNPGYPSKWEEFWVQILTLQLPGWAPLGKTLNLSEPPLFRL